MGGIGIGIWTGEAEWLIKVGYVLACLIGIDFVRGHYYMDTPPPAHDLTRRLESNPTIGSI